MRPRLYRAFTVGIGFFIIAGILYGYLRSVAAEDGSLWLNTATPTLTKVVDLPDSTPPDSNNTDCSKETYVASNLTAPETICTFASPLGELTTSGRIRVGNNKLTRLEGPTAQSVFMPTVDASVAVVSLRASTIGNNVGVYRHLTKAALLENIIYGENAYYNVPAMPDELVKNPVTGQPLQISTYNVAFSRNGEWMVADMPHDGLVRVHMTDLSVKLFAAPIEPEWYLGLANPSLAVSNDGRYAAANIDMFTGNNLSVYDLSTCTDQLNVATYDRTYCAGKNIWQGHTLTGQPMGGGILAQRPDLQSPTHLRFIDDETISFSALYDVSGPSFKAANFVVTAPGVTQHRLGLLGIGDSYISGQGAFDYREGTDTANDGCHLSESAYPFILGKEAFNSYNSVACSGAVTGNVIGDNQKYEGQVKDKIPEEKRNKAPILANFLPGYIYQQEFASTYKPEAIVLSVGGDDVGFADIVKQCVANEGGGTCYDTYEDRIELLQEINRTYPKLVNTYTTLREQSGGARIYVVGYPQIAKPGGDCGLNVHLNAEEVVFSAQLIDYLDDVLHKAAETAGVFYVDTTHAFDGYRLCEARPGQNAMNGFTVGGDAGVVIGGHAVNFIGTESYHPTKLGHQLLAQTISQKTSKLGADMPRATAYAAPQLDPAAPILQGIKHENRSTNTTYRNVAITSDATQAGETLQIEANGTEAALKPGVSYQIVLHSTPVTLGTGIVDGLGNVHIEITLPAAVTPGYHTVHIYTTNMAGEPVDIQKPLYIFPNGQAESGAGGSCVLFTASGQDDDQDGTDDACDAEIGSRNFSAGESTTLETSVPDRQVDIRNSAKAISGRKTEPGQVLGVATQQGNNHSATTKDMIALDAAPQELTRVDWTRVLIAGMVLTSVLTAGYYYWMR